MRHRRSIWTQEPRLASLDITLLTHLFLAIMAAMKKSVKVFFFHGPHTDKNLMKIQVQSIDVPFNAAEPTGTKVARVFTFWGGVFGRTEL